MNPPIGRNQNSFECLRHLCRVLVDFQAGGSITALCASVSWVVNTLMASELKGKLCKNQTWAQFLEVWVCWMQCDGFVLLGSLLSPLYIATHPLPSLLPDNAWAFLDPTSLLASLLLGPVCLSTCLHACLSTCPVCQSTFLPVHLSAYVPICLSKWVLVCLSTYPSAHLSTCPGFGGLGLWSDPQCSMCSTAICEGSKDKGHSFTTHGALWNPVAPFISKTSHWFPILNLWYVGMQTQSCALGSAMGIQIRGETEGSEPATASLHVDTQ